MSQSTSPPTVPLANAPSQCSNQSQSPQDAMLASSLRRISRHEARDKLVSRAFGLPKDELLATMFHIIKEKDEEIEKSETDLDVAKARASVMADRFEEIVKEKEAMKLRASGMMDKLIKEIEKEKDGKIKGLEMRLEKAESSASGVADQFKEIVKGKDQKIRKIGMDLQHERAGADRLRESIRHRDGEIEKLKTNLQDTESRASGMTHRLEEIIKEKDGEIEKLEIKLQDAESRASDLTNEVEELQGRLHDMRMRQTEVPLATNSHQEKTSTPKRKRKSKAERSPSLLSQPLSEMTKDWTHVPLGNVEAYVNRSKEVRQKEVENSKTPGKVKRPLNAFMLYRMAYHKRITELCFQNNHQVVSQVCGDSWLLETAEVKKQFADYYRIEIDNHRKAHPGYKFSPKTAKNRKKGKATKVIESSEESELSELPDSDFEDLGL